MSWSWPAGALFKTACVSCGPLARPPPAVARAAAGEVGTRLREPLAEESRRHLWPRDAAAGPSRRLPPARAGSALVRVAPLPHLGGEVAGEGRGRRGGASTDLWEGHRPIDTSGRNPSHPKSTARKATTRCGAEQIGTSLRGKDLRGMVVFSCGCFFIFLSFLPFDPLSLNRVIK